MAVEDTEIRRLVSILATTRSDPEAEQAWDLLRPLGVDVVPYLAAAYPTTTRYQGRVALVFHSIRYARVSAAAFDLGVMALEDRATLVRYRACGLLAYSLRRDAVPALRKITTHLDVRTAEDARAAIRAIEARNHHLFVSRNGSGFTRWVVNPEDEHEPPPVDGVGRLLRRFLRR
jgi:hypothetical protein